MTEQTLGCSGEILGVRMNFCIRELLVDRMESSDLAKSKLNVYEIVSEIFDDVLYYM